MWKWSTVNGRNTQEPHGQECLTRTKSVPEASHCWPSQTEMLPSSTALMPPSLLQCGLCSSSPAPSARGLNTALPDTHRQGAFHRRLQHHTGLESLDYCGNVFWKVCQPLPHTEETAESRVWDSLLGSLETPKVHSDSHLCCYAHRSRREAGLFLCTLEATTPLTPSHLCPTEVPRLLTAWQRLRVRIKPCAVTHGLQRSCRGKKKEGRAGGRRDMPSLWLIHNS